MGKISKTQESIIKRDIERILAESSSDDESFSLEELCSRIVLDIETQYFQTSFEMRRFEIIFRNRDIFRVPSGRS